MFLQIKPSDKYVKIRNGLYNNLLHPEKKY